MNWRDRVERRLAELRRESQQALDATLDAGFDFACECGGRVRGRYHEQTPFPPEWLVVGKRPAAKTAGVPCDSCDKTYTVELHYDPEGTRV